MEKTAVLPEKAIDADIDAMLEMVSVRASDAYRLGLIEGQMRLINNAMANLKNEMGRPADLFYNMLLRIIPQEDILQHRIGLDYTTKVPTTLTVISSKHEDKMDEIMGLGTDLDLYMFHEHGYECQFWVTTDYCLDQVSIERDFPFYKKIT